MTPGARRLTGRDGQTFTFDPGALCLELLVTGGFGPYVRYELLHEPGDLGAWLTGSRLAGQAPLTADDVRVDDEELAAIKRFRRALWPVVEAIANDERPRTADLRVLNEATAAPAPRPVIDLGTGELAWSTPITGTEVLGAFARDAVELVSGPLRARIRECGGDNCRLLFVDTSRPGRRRWCSMERCGNRHKVRDYRARRADSAG
ncbi:MAG: hypothetical protein GEV11_24320 [Streptosporangiales bacterium]|nr:hypothetical protein [Streptosporangiales bacterium]